VAPVIDEHAVLEPLEQIHTAVSVSLFVACSVSKARMGQVALPITPFLLALLVALLIVTFWPGAVLWLPQWLGP
jgi:C4-dicarboxylate transporter DctM subunit